MSSLSTDTARRSAAALVAALATAVRHQAPPPHASAPNTPPAPPGPDTPGTRAGAGRATAPARGPRVVSERRTGPRTVDLLIDSPALGHEAPVRLLLPRDFDRAPHARWPVLCLLHGAHDDHTSWTRETDIEAFTADKGVLTVLPYSGPTGIPTDWWRWGRPGAPDYETFQVDEVMDVLRCGYRAARARAVAGISTGGYGAMAQAARHPGAFRAAASYSGLTDTTLRGMPAFVHSLVAREHLPPRSLWGSPRAQSANWHAHNPRAGARALQGTALYVSCGSGGGDGSGGGALKHAEDPWRAEVLESVMWTAAKSFTARLEQLGIPATTHLYSGGTHTWPYWWREFRRSWPLLAQSLGLGSDSEPGSGSGPEPGSGSGSGGRGGT
ncbi:alpha/beta hydrolase [Streptomyces sp. NPDC054796]